MENNMYSGGYALCIISNGKVLPELADGSVLCGFGQEYKIRLRNKNYKRAKARVWIDGEEITRTAEADGLVIQANGFIDLERPLDAAVRFKFVSRETKEAIEAGKDGPDPRREMGVIRVEMTEEADLPQPVRQTLLPNAHPRTRKDWYLGPDDPNHRYSNNDFQVKLTSDNSRGYGAGGQSVGLNFMAGGCNVGGEVTASLNSKEPDNSGCTVEGSHSSQKFVPTHFLVSDKPATVLQVVLKGTTSDHIQAASSSLRKNRADKAVREEIANLEARMVQLQKQLDALKSF